MSRRRSNTKPSQSSAPWWAAVVVGVGLTITPEPTTTAAGLAILAGALGAAGASRSA